jgi:oligopeptide transport system substrate-binding protein
MVTGDATHWTDPDRVISNGPYRLKSRRFKQDLLLVQNEHYWNKAAMRNRSIRERIIPDAQTGLMVYRNGKADWLPEVPTTSSLAADLVAQAKSGGRDDVHTSPWAGTYFYNFNCMEKLPDGTPNPLHDARVRRALSMTIERDTIVNRVTRLELPTARTFIPPGSLPGYDAPVDAGVGFDPAAAKELLAEAGYADGAELRGLSILYNNNAGHASIAQQIKRGWEKHLGVSVQLEGLEGKNFSRRLREHQFTISRASWIGDYRDATTFLDKFKSDNGNNDAGYANPRYDELMAAAAKEQVPSARLRLLREAEALMLGEQPIAPIYHYITLNVYDPGMVKGIYPNPWNFRRLELVEVRRDSN